MIKIYFNEDKGLLASIWWMLGITIFYFTSFINSIKEKLIGWGTSSWTIYYFYFTLILK